MKHPKRFHVLGKKSTRIVPPSGMDPWIPSSNSPKGTQFFNGRLRQTAALRLVDELRDVGVRLLGGIKIPKLLRWFLPRDEEVKPTQGPSGDIFSKYGKYNHISGSGSEKTGSISWKVRLFFFFFVTSSGLGQSLLMGDSKKTTP